MNDLNEDQRKAFKAFKKKIKAQQLDSDSRLGRSPLSGSGHERIVAIAPPTGFGRAVWDELVTKGYLRHDGGNFYELVSGKKD